MPLAKFLTVKNVIISGPEHCDNTDMIYKPAYAWWNDNFGFWPIFLAVGIGPETIRMTGYSNQFSKIISSKWDSTKKKRVYQLRTKGNTPNYVLMSFTKVDCLPHKFNTWENILCFATPTTSCSNNHEPYAKIPSRLTNAIKGHTVKTIESWIQTALKQDGKVQACAPQLNMSEITEIKVRNLETKKLLEKLGYTNISVLRLKAPRWE